MTANSDERGAVLQIEIDLTRWHATKVEHSFHGEFSSETPWNRLYNIAKTAACDTLNNGGTLVIIRDGNTITMVQRPAETAAP